MNGEPRIPGRGGGGLSEMPYDVFGGATGDGDTGAGCDDDGAPEEGRQRGDEEPAEALGDSTASSVLLAHVVQLRSLWKFENANCKALCDVLACREDELAACLGDVRRLEDYMQFIDEGLLSALVPWSLPTLFRAGSDLVLGAVPAEAANVYLLSRDGSQLLGWLSQEQRMVSHAVGSGVVGLAPLVEEPTILGPNDPRLRLCQTQAGVLRGGLVVRVTDRSGEVFGVVEVLNRLEQEGEAEGDGQGGGFTRSDADALAGIEDQLLAVLRALRIVLEQSEHEEEDRSQRHRSLISRLLHALRGSVAGCRDARLYMTEHDPLSHTSDTFALVASTSSVEGSSRSGRAPPWLAASDLRNAGTVRVPAAEGCEPQLWVALQGRVDGELVGALQVLERRASRHGHAERDSFTATDILLAEAFARAFEVVVMSQKEQGMILESLDDMDEGLEVDLRATSVAPFVDRDLSTSAIAAESLLATPVRRPLQAHEDGLRREMEQRDSPAPSPSRAMVADFPAATRFTSPQLSSSASDSVFSQTMALLGAKADPKAAISQVETYGQRVLGCGRIVVWAVDHTERDLWAPSGTSIAHIALASDSTASSAAPDGATAAIAQVASTGKSFQISAARARGTGFKSDLGDDALGDGLLCVPIKDPRGNMVGVLCAAGMWIDGAEKASGRGEQTRAEDMASAIGALLPRILQVMELEARVKQVKADAEEQAQEAQALRGRLKKSESSRVDLARQHEQDLSALQSELGTLKEEMKAMTQDLDTERREVKRLNDELEGMEDAAEQDHLRIQNLEAALNDATKHRDHIVTQTREEVSRYQTLSEELKVLKEAHATSLLQLSRNGEVHALLDTLRSELRVPTMLDKLAKHLKHVCHAAHAVVYLYDRQRQEVALHSSTCRQTSLDGQPLRFSASVGIVGYAARTGDVLCVPDTSRDARFNRAVDEVPAAATSSALAVPVVGDGGTVVAVVLLTNRMDGPFEDADEDRVSELVKYLASTVSRCMRYEEECRSAEERQKMLEADVRKLQQQWQVCEQELRESEDRVRVLEAELHKSSDEESDVFDAEQRDQLLEELEVVKAERDSTTEKLELKTRILSMVAQVEGEVRLRVMVRLLADSVASLMKAQHCILYLVNRERRELTNAAHSGLAQTQADNRQTPSPHTGTVSFHRGSMASQTQPSSSAGSPSRQSSLATNFNPSPPRHTSIAGPVPYSQGIAGYVARTGETLSLVEAYRDARFDPTVDEVKGQVSHSILSTALRDGKGEIIAVLHIINSKDGRFSETELGVQQELVGPVGSLLARAMQYEQICQSTKEVATQASADLTRAQQHVVEKEEALAVAEAELAVTQEQLNEAERKLEDQARLASVVASISRQSTLPQVMAEIQSTVAAMLNAESATCLLISRDGGGDGEGMSRLWYPGDGQAPEAYMGMTSGLAAQVARTGEAASFSDSSKDRRAIRQRDERSGTLMRNAICVPVFDEDGEVLGVLQACNKQQAEAGLAATTFTEPDLIMLQQVASSLADSVRQQLFKISERKVWEKREAELLKLEGQLHESIAKLQTQVTDLQSAVVKSEGQVQALGEILEQHKDLLKLATDVADETSATSLLGHLNDAPYRILQCEQMLLLLLDQTRDELWTLAVQRSVRSPPRGTYQQQSQQQQQQVVRFSMAKAGTSGVVAKIGKPFRIADMARDCGLQQGDVFTAMGLVVRNALAVPVCDSQGEIVGVLHALNKSSEDATFSDQDEALLVEIARHLGLVVTRCTQHAKLEADLDGVKKQKAAEVVELQTQLTRQVQAVERLQSQLKVVEAEAKLTEGRLAEKTVVLRFFELEGFHSTNDLRGAVSHVCTLIAKHLQAGRAIIFFVDDREDSDNRIFVWTFGLPSKEGRVTLPTSDGLLGHVLRTGEVVRVENAYRDPRFSNQDVDDRLGIVTAAAICCPLTTTAGATIAVLQVCNRVDSASGGRFTEDDETAVVELGRHAANAVAPLLALHLQREQYEANEKRLRESFCLAQPPRELPVLDVLTFCKAAAAHVREAIRVDSASVLLIDEDEREAFVPSADGRTRRRVLRNLLSGATDSSTASMIRGEAVKLDQRVWEQVVTRQEPLFMPNRKTAALKDYQFHAKSAAVEVSSAAEEPRVRARTRSAWASLGADSSGNTGLGGPGQGGRDWYPEDRESIYYPLLVAPLVGRGGKGQCRVIGIVHVSGKSQEAESFGEADLHELSIVAGHLALALYSHAVLTNEVHERVQGRIVELVQDTTKARTIMAQLASVVRSACITPSFEGSFRALNEARASSRLRHKRMRTMPTYTGGGSSRSRDQLRTVSLLQTAQTQSAGGRRQGSNPSFITMFRRMVCALVACDDVAVLLKAPTADADEGVKGVPARVLRQAAAGRQCVRWSSLDDQQAKAGRTRAGCVDDDDDSCDVEAAEPVVALCVPVPREGDEAGVLVLLWRVPEEEEEEHGREKIEASSADIPPEGTEVVATYVACLLSLAIERIAPVPHSRQPAAQPAPSADVPACIVAPPAPARAESAVHFEAAAVPDTPDANTVLEVVERLLAAGNFSGLFDAVRSALGTLVPHTRARLYLIDKSTSMLWTPGPHASGVGAASGAIKIAADASPPDAASNQQQQHRTRGVAVTSPMSAGILGHVARSGVEELVWSLTQHLYYDVTVDVPECRCSGMAADGSSSAGTTASPTVCSFCSKRPATVFFRGGEGEPALTPEYRQAWDTHHSTIPRLYVPLRPLGGGSPIGVVKVEFDVEGNDRSKREQVEQLVARVRRLATAVQACVSRVVQATDMKASVDRARDKLAEAGRCDEMLRLTQQTVSVHKMQQLAEVASGPLAKLLRADRVALFVTDERQQQLLRVRPPVEGGGGGHAPVPFGEGLIGHAAQTCKVVRVPTTEDEGDADRDGDADLVREGWGGPDCIGFRTDSVLAVPILPIASSSADGGPVAVGVLLLQNRQGLRHFTKADESLVVRFCACLSAAIALCRATHDSFCSSIVDRLLECLLSLPDATLGDLPVLGKTIAEALTKHLHVDGARVLLLAPPPSAARTEAADRGHGESGVIEGLLVRPSTDVEQWLNNGGDLSRSTGSVSAGDGSSVHTKPLELVQGSITSVALKEGRAVAVPDTQADSRFHRACDKGHGFFGVVPLPKRVMTPGGRLHSGKHIGLLQVWSHRDVKASNTTFPSSSSPIAGLLDCTTADAEMVLQKVSTLVGLLLEWCLQGRRAAQRLREILQGIGAVVCSAVHDVGAIFTWVHTMVPKMCGVLKPQLYLLDSATGELLHTSSDGTETRIRPADASLAGRALKLGQPVVQRGGMPRKGGRRDVSGDNLSACLLPVLVEHGCRMIEQDDAEVDGSARALGLIVCYPVRTPHGRLVGALELSVPPEADQVALSAAANGTSHVLHVDVESISHVVQLVGIAVDRFHTRIRAASTLKECKEERERTLQEMTEALCDVTARQAELRGDNQRLAEDNQRLSTENEGFKRDVDLIHAALKEELEESEARAKRMKKDRDVLLMKYKDNKASLLKHQAKLAQISTSITAMQQEIHSAKAERDMLVEEVAAQKERAMEDLIKAHHELELSREALTKAKVTQKATAEELEKVRQRIRAAETEASSLRRQLLATSSSMSKEMKELEALRKENAALRGHQGALKKGLHALAQIERNEIMRMQAESKDS